MQKDSAWGSEPQDPDDTAAIGCFSLSFKSRRSSNASSQSNGGAKMLRKLSLRGLAREQDSPISGLRGSPSTIDTGPFSVEGSSTQCSISQPLSLTTRGPTSCPNLSTPDGSAPGSPRTSLITARHDQSEPLVLPTAVQSSLTPAPSHSLWNNNTPLLDKSIASGYHSVDSSSITTSKNLPPLSTKEHIHRHASHDLSLTERQSHAFDTYDDTFTHTLSQDALALPSNSSPLLLLTPAQSPSENGEQPPPPSRCSPPRPSRQRLGVVISQPETADSWQDSLLLNMLVNSTMVVGADSQPSSMENPQPSNVLQPVNRPAFYRPSRQLEAGLLLTSPAEINHELLDQSVLSAALASGTSLNGYSFASGSASERGSALGGSTGHDNRDSGGSSTGNTAAGGSSKVCVVVAGVPVPVHEDGWPEGGWTVGLHGPMAPSYASHNHAMSWPYMSSKDVSAAGLSGANMLAVNNGKQGHSAPLLQPRFKGRHMSSGSSVHGGLVLGTTQDLMSIAEDQEEDE